MKLFHLAAMVILAAFSANVFAQPVAPGRLAKSIKITKITGTVNVMKDGMVIMTLRPGDAIPEITDNKVTFVIVDGTVEVEAGGKKISGATGSNFTVTSNEGQVNVSLGAGTPVSVKTESGFNVILTANSEVKLVNANGKVEISMEKGNAVVTNSSGGDTQTVKPGQTVVVPVNPLPPPAPVDPGLKPVDPLPEPLPIPDTGVNPIQELSPSTP